MNSILSIKSSNQYLNFEQSGYFKNIKTGIQFAPSVNLLPFFERLQTYTGFTPSVQQFYLLSLNCRGDIVETKILDIGAANVSVINDDIIIQYNADTNLISAFSTFTQGIYKYKIHMSTERTYYSEPFLIDYSKFIPILGDFDPADFNNDFFTTG